jgi:hypothetical protein
MQRGVGPQTRPGPKAGKEKPSPAGAGDSALARKSAMPRLPAAEVWEQARRQDGEPAGPEKAGVSGRARKTAGREAPSPRPQSPSPVPSPRQRTPPQCVLRPIFGADLSGLSFGSLFGVYLSGRFLGPIFRVYLLNPRVAPAATQNADGTITATPVTTRPANATGLVRWGRCQRFLRGEDLCKP